MNILVLGSGGREHAIAWKLRQSPRCQAVYLHPGNAGTLQAGFEPLTEADGINPQSIISAAKSKNISLIVIGPEAMLEQGYADQFRAAGFAVSGPGEKGVQLESSKIFAKLFMQRAGIPSAPFLIAENDRELLAFTAQRETWPIVVKLDGLAAGKGVVVAQNYAEVEAFATRIWINKEFGPGPHRLIIEEFIAGRELSYIGLCDGKVFVPLSSATDYKRIGNGNSGPNTGGMGAISPSPLMTPELKDKIDRQIILRLLAELKAEDIAYRGALYVGVMVDDAGNPFVLEFNARFGDPETQALLIRLDDDLATLLEDTAHGRLSQHTEFKFKPQVALYVVAAAEGYPLAPKLGDPITGVDSVDKDVQVFFSGVSNQQGSLATGGGRVLGLGALGEDVEGCRHKIYRNLQRVNWKAIYYRNDIGL